ncbi:MAG: O-antigen ligase family protein [bacterium]|nr:O-antigen ligase family protein [bacterium]
MLTLLPTQLKGFPISLAVIMLCWLMFITLFKRKEARILKKSPLDIPLTYLVILLSFSVVTTLLTLSYAPITFVFLKWFQSIPSIFTTYPEDRFISAIHSYRTLVIGIAFFYLLLFYLKEHDKNCDRIITTLLIASGFMSGYGLIQYVTQWNLLEYWKHISPNLTRINSTFTDPNTYGVYLILVIPIVIAKVLSARGVSFIKYSGLIFLLLLNLLWTGSRAAWFSFVLSSIFMVIIISFSRMRKEISYQFIRNHFTKISIILLIVGISTTIILIIISTQNPTTTDLSQHKSYWDVLKFSLNTHADADTILKNRIPLWQAAFAMVTYQPLVGIGIGSYPFWLEYFLKPGVTTFLRIAYAHNYYLQFAAELGLIGFGLFLWLIIVIFIIGWKAIRNNGLVPLGLLTGLIAFLLAQLTQHSLVQVEMQLLFWIPVALLTSLSPDCSSTTTFRHETNLQRKNINVISAKANIGVFILLLIAVYGYNSITSDKVKDRLDYTVGMYKPEQNSGYYFRWINKLAYKKIGIRARKFTLPILTYRLDTTQYPVTVSIYLNHTLIDRLTLTRNGWGEYEFIVPNTIPSSKPGKKDAVLSILVDKTWNPWQRQEGTTIWDYRRLGIGVAQIQWAQPMEPTDHLELDLGNISARPYLATGWFADELTADKRTSYIWSQGTRSELFLPLIPEKNYAGILRVMPFVYPNAPPQIIHIFMNNFPLQSITLKNEWSWQEVKFSIPSYTLSTTANNILKLEYSRVNVPKDVIPDSIDTREIAVSCDSVIVIPEP